MDVSGIGRAPPHGPYEPDLAWAAPETGKPLQGGRFVVFERSNGTKVACQLSLVQFLAKGDDGSVLHFGGSSQVNVSQSFDEVLTLLNSEP